MRLTFLGTGTSTGVPQIGCNCAVCRSSDPRDKRLRTSALVEVDDKQLLIDCGPDFRQQMLRIDGSNPDALLVTHSHYDHLGGIDDLRPYCISHPSGFPIYCRPDVARDIRIKMPYCFPPHHYPGAPTFAITEISESEFSVDGIPVTPLPMMHNEHYRINGYRIGNLSYITDCKIFPESSFKLAEGTDTLVLNALRHEMHPSHLNLLQALEIISRIKPRMAYLTHFSHQIGRHTDISRTLPDNIKMAYDGLTIEIP